MPSLKLSNPFRRGADRPSLKQRAASLKATAAQVMKRKAADPLDGTSCPPGFVPYPFDKPMSYASVPAAIHAEAVRLLDLAQAEYARRCGSFGDHVNEEGREAVRRAARTRLQLDTLAALVERRPAVPGNNGADAGDALWRMAPSSLGAACDWAIGHIDWINTTAGSEGWDDARLDEECEKSDAIWERAIAEPSTSVGDVAAKARMLLQDLEEEFSDCEIEKDRRDCLTLTLLREVGALAPPATAGTQAKTPPIGLVCEILAGWRAWVKEQAADLYPTAEYDRPAEIERDRLIDAVDALPATAENVMAKSLILAWMEYAELWRRGWRREQYTTDGRLALDIHAGVLGFAVKS